MKFLINLINTIKGRVSMNKDIRYNVDEIANYFLSKSEMTPKKLQKILYFAYAWYLAIMNESKDELNIKLFNNQFEAWIHGPVCPEIYAEYKSYGANPIPKKDGITTEFTREDLDVLEQVWDVYGQYTANQLESITHQHDPWINTRKKANCSTFDWCNSVISDESIFEYYASKLS